MSQVSKILEDAATLIEQYGWIQQYTGNKEVGFCALGAIYEASKGKGSICLMADDKLREVIGRPGIATWNDDPMRNKFEVIEALREAANRG